MSSQLIKPLKIFEKIKRFIYKLELLTNMKIYDVISIIYLKPIIDLVENLYRYRRLFIFIIIIKNEKKYEIEKLL